jgi:NAD(P)-dependent dehydrogenase (short-subunit alcohol dehydrogenase family)
LVTLLVAENSTQQALAESALREAVAPAGITANAILAGVTDTPALRLIPAMRNWLRSRASAIRTNV